MENIRLDYSNSFIKSHEMEGLFPSLEASHNLLHEGRGLGGDFRGWLDLPNTYDREEYEALKKSVAQIRKDSDILLVIGIGGSYLGSRACIEALGHSFSNQLDQEEREGPEIYYVGNNISSKYILDLLDLFQGRDLSINVISKSGKTTEPALAFRFLKEYMEEKYGKKEARERIYITTDAGEGALKTLSDREGYTSFAIPDDVGGRFSIFTPVGLLPIGVAGLDLDKLLEGARDGVEEYALLSLEKNPCYQYALARNILRNKGMEIELLVNYEPSLYYFSEWWKQLFGESEGKDGKGLFPASVNFTTDLHSMGQMIQDGRKNLFETSLNIEEPEVDLEIRKNPDNLDGLNYLGGRTVDYVNKKAFEATVMAHVEGGVPNLIINIPKMDEYYFGKLIYFFEKACAISAYMMGVNPFDQPGVEAYKENMFKLLGKK